MNVYTHTKTIYSIAARSLIEEQQETPSVSLNWNQSRHDINKKPSDSETFQDILIPSLLILGLLIVNASIIFMIFRCRNRRFVHQIEYQSNHIRFMELFSHFQIEKPNRRRSTFIE